MLLLLYLSIANLLCNGAQYDLSGRVPQVEFAGKASMTGSTVLVTRTGDDVIALAISQRPPSHGASRKLKFLSNSLGYALSGFPCDCRHVSKIIEEKFSDHVDIFDEALNGVRLAECVAESLHQATRFHQQRPMAVNVCLFGYDRIGKKPSILEIDNFGAIRHCSTTAMGLLSNSLGKELRVKGLEVQPLPTGIEQCIHAVQNVVREECAGDNGSTSQWFVDLAIVGRRLDGRIFEDIPVNDLSLDILQ